MSTPWWQVSTFPPPHDQGLFYLWSPLVIFFICLGILVVLILFAFICCMMYNVCTYGTCCNCPTYDSTNGMMCWNFCCCCLMPRAEPTKVVRRSGGDTVRRSRSQIIVEDDPCDDSVVVVNKHSDGKRVRMSDSARSSCRGHHHRPPIDISDDCQQRPPPPQIIIQQVPTPTIAPMPPAPPAPAPCQGGCGSNKPTPQLNVIVGNATKTNRPNQFVMNMNMSSGGGSDRGSYGGQTQSKYTEYHLMPVSGGESRGMITGGDGCYNNGYEGNQQDNGSCFSDGHSSAVIEIGHGQRNSFYPSLPNYGD